MTDRRRCRLVVVLCAALGLAVGSAACTQTPPAGRVGDEGTQPADGPGASGTRSVTGGVGDTTTLTPTTQPEAKAATNAANICRGRADSFLPDHLAGYAVAASGDITSTIPPGAARVQSARAALVRRDGDGKEGLMSAVVFEEQRALSAVASATVDLLLQAIGGKSDVVDTLVNGYEARTTTGPNGISIIAWPECLNVWVLVQGPDAQMAADLAAKVHSQ